MEARTVGLGPVEARTFRSALATAIWAVWFVAGLTATSGQGARPSIAGVLHDEAGRPVAHADIQACTASVCFPSETGADGRFLFDLQVATPVRVFLKTPEQLTTTPRRATTMFPVEVKGPGRLDAGAVVVPNLPAAVPLPTGNARQTVAVGDGLELSLVGAALKPAPGHVLMGLAARRLPDARLPRYRLPAGERLVAVYALHPFGAISDTPVGVRLPSTLAAGTPVKFWTLGELDGALLAPAPGRATGTHVVTDADGGITVLTYLLVSR